MSSEVSSRILVLVAQVLEGSPSQLRPEQRLIEDLGASSLDIAEIIWRVEEDPFFQIGEIPDETLDKLSSIKDIIDFIEDHADLPTPSLHEATLVLGADRHGLQLRDALQAWLVRQGHPVQIAGADADVEIDLVEVAQSVAALVASHPQRQGMLIGLDGHGMALVANKVAGVRAVAAEGLHTARLARARHNANVLCLGAGLIGPELARVCLETFLHTSFEPDQAQRRTRRMNRIAELERRWSS